MYLKQPREKYLQKRKKISWNTKMKNLNNNSRDMGQ